MNILIIGDSFAADWSGVDSTYPGWPQLLAKKHSVTNLAQAGCGEYRILQQLKSQQDLDQYNWIIVCHTSSARIHTRQHPIHHNSQLHKHADLIFTDIEYHAAADKKQRNRSLTAAHDFFIYHYDDAYNQDIHQLIVKEIHQTIGNRPTIIVDNFNQLDPTKYKFFLDFTKIAEVVPGKINHCSSQGNLDICHRILDIIDQPETILPGFVLKSMRLFESDYLLPDEPLYTKLNENYPWPVSYKFNSRGYRDQSWPDDLQTLKNSPWCIGDSATMGIGAPIEHSWPSRLELKLNVRSIKIAMGGASNNWIFRQAEQILKEIQPKIIVIQWSLLNRREINDSIIREQHWQIFYNGIKDPSWPDCKFEDISQLPQEIQFEINNGHCQFNAEVPDEIRRVMYDDITTVASDDVEHTINLIKQLESIKCQSTLVHGVVPNFTTPENKELFYKEINSLSINFIPEFAKLDLARDQAHYDIKTSEFFVGEVLKLI